MQITLHKTSTNVPLFFELDGDEASSIPGVALGYYSNKYTMPATLKVVNRLKEFGGISVADVECVFRFDLEYTWPTSLIPKELASRLYPHQIEAVQFAGQNYHHGYKPGVRVMLADDPRLGKSIQAIAIHSMFGGDAPVLIVAPKPTIGQWINYVEDWLPDCRAVVLSGTTVQKLKLIRTYESMPKIVFICNSEALISVPYKTLPTFSTVIFDEAHKLKNRKTKIAKFMQKVKSTNLLLLSGTFMENTPDDLWQPLNLLDPERFSNYWRWVDHYVKTVSTSYGMKLVGPKNSDLMGEEIAPYYIRRKLDQFPNVPTQIINNYRVDLTKDHIEFYNRVKQEVLLEFDNDEKLFIPNVVSRLTRLRQVVSMPKLVDPSSTIVSEKFTAVLNYIENEIPEQDQVIVYSGFQGVVKSFANFSNFITYTDDDPSTNVSDFTSGKYRVIATTFQKGGVGLNLFNADWVLYYDLPFSSILYRQSIERVRKLDKLGHVTIVKFLAHKTIDVTMNKLLGTKLGNMSKADLITVINDLRLE